MPPRLVVSEFPNDNPELHDGLVWACPAPCARPLPTLRLRSSPAAKVLRPHWEPPSDEVASPTSAVPVPSSTLAAGGAGTRCDAEVLVSDESKPAPEDDGSVPVEPQANVAAAVPETPSGFRAFVRALESVLLERGATRAAVGLPGLFGEVRLAPDAFDSEIRATLTQRRILDGKTQRPTLEFSCLAGAWRDILEGTSTDLSTCGNTMLDAWGAELLATLLGDTRGADALRRALRQRGVAAFGMLAAA